MNTYVVEVVGPPEQVNPWMGMATVEASNPHTAIRRVLYPIHNGRKAVRIKRGEKLTIHVERTK